jgi:hypothetical protein
MEMIQLGLTTTVAMATLLLKSKTSSTTEVAAAPFAQLTRTISIAAARVLPRQARLPLIQVRIPVMAIRVETMRRFQIPSPIREQARR